MLNTPNRITKADFDNWVEQRGSKFWSIVGFAVHADHRDLGSRAAAAERRLAAREVREGELHLLRLRVASAAAVWRAGRLSYRGQSSGAEVGCGGVAAPARAISLTKVTGRAGIECATAGGAATAGRHPIGDLPTLPSVLPNSGGLLVLRGIADRLRRCRSHGGTGGRSAPAAAARCRGAAGWGWRYGDLRPVGRDDRSGHRRAGSRRPRRAWSADAGPELRRADTTSCASSGSAAWVRCIRPGTRSSTWSSRSR